MYEGIVLQINVNCSVQLGLSGCFNIMGIIFSILFQLLMLRLWATWKCFSQTVNGNTVASSAEFY